MIKRDLIQLYQFRVFNTEKFIELYLQEISEREEIDDINVLGGQCTYRTIKAHVGVRKPELIISKCQYLQDTIIRRAHAKNDDCSFSLSSSVLKKVIGKEYKPMLNVLIQMGYIELGNGNHGIDKHYYYKSGAYSKLYLLKDVPIHCWYGYDPVIQKYRAKAEAALEEYQENVIHPAIDSRYGDAFRKQYVISLNYFRVDDEEGLDSFLKANGYDDEASNFYVYYKDIQAKLDERKDIYSVDGNGRIYHVLCNLNKDLKRYINIDYSLDCKNSHPLLFNYFIFLSHDISCESSYNIVNYISGIDINNHQQKAPTPDIYHNVGKFLRKNLIDNNIENSSVAKLTNDELEYIYLTSVGRLWDEINIMHPEYTRKGIKNRFFAEVLYSSTASTQGKPFAKEFVELFPSVYELICKWKEPKKNVKIYTYLSEHHLYSPKEHAALSIALMSLEAHLFTEILKIMYAKRWRAVNIHDCIVVPITGKKNRPEPEDVMEIMATVFAAYGLHPTFDLSI